MAENVKMVLSDARKNDTEYDGVFSKATQMAEVYWNKLNCPDSLHC
jgi:hypothetical protein